MDTSTGSVSRAVRYLEAYQPRPRAFALAPDGSAVASSRGADPVAYALERCRQLYRRCQL